MHRSPGTAGQPGDAASRRRSPCRDRGLLDDHPAAAVALHRAPVQWPAPCLVEVLRVDGASAHQPPEIFIALGEQRLLGCLLCLQIPIRLASTAQAWPQE